MNRKLITILLLSISAFAHGQSKKDIVQAQLLTIDSLNAVVAGLRSDIAQERLHVTSLQHVQTEAQEQIMRSGQKLDSLIARSAMFEQQMIALALQEYREIPWHTQGQEDAPHRSVVLHRFSNPLALDTFKVWSTGNDGEHPKLALEIKSHSGKVLLREEVDALTLDDHEWNGEEYVLAGDPDSIIASACRNAMDRSAFRIPAIDEDEDQMRRSYIENGDGNLYDIDEETWKAIGSDPYSVAFTVQIGWEDTRTFVFDKRTGTVVNIHPAHP